MDQVAPLVLRVGFGFSGLSAVALPPPPLSPLPPWLLLAQPTTTTTAVDGVRSCACSAFEPLACQMRVLEGDEDSGGR